MSFMVSGNHSQLPFFIFLFNRTFLTVYLYVHLNTFDFHCNIVYFKISFFLFLHFTEEKKKNMFWNDMR